MLLGDEVVLERRRLLVFSPSLSLDPGRSFPVLILKYLKGLGWDPIIVTVHPDHKVPGTVINWCEVKIVEALPSSGHKVRLISWLYRKRTQLAHRRALLRAESRGMHFREYLLTGGALALLPLAAVTGTGFSGRRGLFAEGMWKTALNLHDQAPFHAVLSIYGYMVSHQLACRFSAQTGVPWVALLKDYYSGEQERTGDDLPSVLQWLKDRIKRRYECKILRGCAAIVAYCEPLAEYLRTLIRNVPIRVIPNCYDEEDYADDAALPAGQHRDSFVITSVGNIGYHDLHMFFAALRELHSEKQVLVGTLKVRFVGAEERILRSYIELYDCDDIVEIVPTVPHREAVIQMRQATCLLFPQKPGVLPRRTPEYMAARRPILAFPRCPDAGSEPILEQYGAAAIVSNKEELKATLLSWYGEFQATGKLALPVNEELVHSFSARHRAEELEQVLESVVGLTKTTLHR